MLYNLDMTEACISKTAQKIGPELSKSAVRSVGVVIINGDMVLMVRGWYGTTAGEGVYGFPAGRVEEGETLVHAATRELEEETGLIAREEDLAEFPGNYFESEIDMKYGPEKFAFTVFICNKYRGELKPSSENLPEWIPIENLDNYDTLPSIKKAVNSALKTN